jgi:hypothetical protein
MRNTQNSRLITAGIGLIIFILIRIFWKNEAAQEMAKVFVPFCGGYIVAILNDKKFWEFRKAE